MADPTPLRLVLADCRRLLSVRGEANGPLLARQIAQRIDDLSDEQRTRFFDRLASDFSPDPQAVLAAAQAYADAPDAAHLDPPDAAGRAAAPRAFPAPQPRARRHRGHRAPAPRAAGTAAAPARSWRVVEHDLLHLLSSWFNPGFLEMRKVDWNSPAQLLEQIIHHEAVHQIDGWDDLRRRLQPDRRCFAFFHPQLPDEPLIFVEVALLPEMAGAIAPLIDKRSAPLPAEQFKVAVFYSISNCQPGLRGVSLGNFLIKRVAEFLKRELPQLRTFCTLSPIPGLMAWLHRPDARRRSADRGARAGARCAAACGGDLAAWRQAARLAGARRRQRTTRCGGWRRTTWCTFPRRPHGDPVARFHLDNGARLERLNAQANLSAKGLKESAGLMVNYLYDLAKIELHHDRFAHGEVAHSRAVSALL